MNTSDLLALSSHTYCWLMPLNLIVEIFRMPKKKIIENTLTHTHTQTSNNQNSISDFYAHNQIDCFFSSSFFGNATSFLFPIPLHIFFGWRCPIFDFNLISIIYGIQCAFQIRYKILESNMHEYGKLEFLLHEHFDWHHILFCDCESFFPFFISV